MLLPLGKSRAEVKDRPLNSILSTKVSTSNLEIKMKKRWTCRSIIDIAGDWEEGECGL